MMSIVRGIPKARIFRLLTFIGVLILSYKLYVLATFSLTYQEYSSLDENTTAEQENNEVRLVSQIYQEYSSLDENSTAEQENNEARLACLFPRVDPFKPPLIKLSELDRKPHRCDGFMPDLTFLQGTTIFVNWTAVEKSEVNYNFKHCIFRSFLLKEYSDDDITESDWSKPFNDSVDVESEEFIIVQCCNNESEVISKTYYPLVPRRSHLMELETLRLARHKAENAPKEILNVIFVGFDGMSRHHFMRGMPDSYNYLMNNLSSFDLTMFTQVGSNTFNNILPILAGQSLDEVKRWWTFAKHTDAFPLLWKNYENAGYRTFYAEDYYETAFNYLKRGFLIPPVVHYSRALRLATNADKDVRKGGDYCIGYQNEEKFFLDYLYRFVNTFRDKPIFGFLFLNHLTHDYLNQAKSGDSYLYDFYKSLNEMGHLNRTVLISFSDHGPRTGEIRNAENGMIEGRSPYLILTFPKWFLQKYPDVAQNLKVNTNRLTTPYDVHATLLELLHFKGEYASSFAVQKHGISLLRQIPASRVCENVPIPQEYCLCGQSTNAKIELDAHLNNRIARAVLKEINSRINVPECAVLKLHRILGVSEINLSKLGTLMYRIKLETVPGHAIFEAIATTKLDKKTFIVSDEINRLNLYRGQSECVMNYDKRPFCYCKHLLRKNKN